MNKLELKNLLSNYKEQLKNLCHKFYKVFKKVLYNIKYVPIK